MDFKEKELIELFDYYELKGVDDFISNAKLYDLKSSLIASGFPMSIETDFKEIDSKLVNRGKRLGKYPIGAGENNFLKGVVVNFDIILPIKVWTEWERYCFSPIVSSSSTMHKIVDFRIDNFSKDTDKRVVELWDKIRQEYVDNPTKENYLQLLYSTPVGLKLKARVTCSMMSLRNMYFQRKDHRLPEWRVFCEWLLTIPYFKEFCNIKEE